jgi:hypothetical protein
MVPDAPEPIAKSIQDRIPVKTILIPKEEVEPKHYLSEKALAGIANKKGVSKEKGFGFGAQMLDFEKPSYTIPARYWKDGYDALVRYNEKEIRRLTNTSWLVQTRTSSCKSEMRWLASSRIILANT